MSSIEELEEQIEIPVVLNLHQMRHIVEWFRTQTSYKGTSDCEDLLAESLGNKIGDFGNYGFLVI